jgi:hypothetical protein
MTSIASNTQVSQASFPSKTQVVEKEDTPSYKTYPFALGTSGLVLGGLGGLLKTSLEPDVYSKTEANGESKRLAVKYSQQGNKPLAYATYDHYSAGADGKNKTYLGGTAQFQTHGTKYLAEIPYYTTDSKDLKTLSYETASWNAGLIRKRELGVESPLLWWTQTTVMLDTSLVNMKLKKPIELEGKTFHTLEIFHEGSMSKKAHILLKGSPIEGNLNKTNRLVLQDAIEVALNEKGEIHNAKIDALNGLPVLFKEPLPDMKNVMKDVPAYVNKLKASLVKEEKAFGKNIFLGTLVTGGLGYGLGWFLDWKKRHDRKKVEAEKASTTQINHTA